MAERILVGEVDGAQKAALEHWLATEGANLTHLYGEPPLAFNQWAPGGWWEVWASAALKGVQLMVRQRPGCRTPQRLASALYSGKVAVPAEAVEASALTETATAEKPAKKRGRKKKGSCDE